MEHNIPDDKSQSGGQDRKRINLFSQDYEVRDWAARFGATPDGLKAAVEAVGDEAHVVETRLNTTGN